MMSSDALAEEEKWRAPESEAAEHHALDTARRSRCPAHVNAGHILGVVREAGRPVEGALIGLDWVRGGGDILPLYSSDADGMSDRVRSVRRGLSEEMPTPTMNLHTSTTSGGAFALSFQWFGGDVASAMDSPLCQIFVLIEERSGARVTMRNRGRFQTHMVRAVSLSQVSGGLIANPTQLGDQLGMGADIAMVLAEIRKPMIGLTVAAPSADMYALLAGFEINL